MSSSGAPRVRSMNVGGSDSGLRGVNKSRSFCSRSDRLQKGVKLKEGVGEEEEEAKASSSPAFPSINVPSILRRQGELLRSSSFSLNASCSSDASTDSFGSRASTGRLTRSSSSASSRRKQYASSRPTSAVSDTSSESQLDSSRSKARCGWITPNTDPLYAAFHDEEWGVPLHDDRKLFELLVFSSALSELTWPVILSKREIFREVLANFDPVAVSKLNEKKLTAPGSTAASLLSELKFRAILENARQMSKVIDEFGSFDKYIWSFVNYKPIIGKYRYSRQVPVKTAKADVMSKDLVRRGFRSVGPTVVYSFMQVAGITNDHLTSCYRFQECLAAADGRDLCIKNECEDKNNYRAKTDLSRAVELLSFSQNDNQLLLEAADGALDANFILAP